MRDDEVTIHLKEGIATITTTLEIPLFINGPKKRGFYLGQAETNSKDKDAVYLERDKNKYFVVVYGVQWKVLTDVVREKHEISEEVAHQHINGALIERMKSYRNKSIKLVGTNRQINLP